MISSTAHDDHGAGEAAPQALVLALIDQLAAGQSETLYSLQTAAAALRRRVTELETAVAQVPANLSPTLVALLEELAVKAGSSASAAGAELQESLAADTKRHATNLTATVKRASDAMLEATTAAAERSEAQRSQTEASVEASVLRLQASVTESSTRVHDDLTSGVTRLDAAAAAHLSAADQLVESATKLDTASTEAMARVIDASSDAAAQLEATSTSAVARVLDAVSDGTTQLNERSDAAAASVMAAVDGGAAQLIEHSDASVARLLAGVEDGATHLEATSTAAVERILAGTSSAGEQLGEMSDKLDGATAAAVAALTEARTVFAADVAAATGALESVGANIIEQLIGVLDARDRRDRKLEEQFNKRVEKVTRETDASMRRLIGELEDEADLVRLKESTERATTAQQLTDLLDHLLALPRGKLKELRAEAAKNQEEDKT
jgi:hypothetical protein